MLFSDRETRKAGRGRLSSYLEFIETFPRKAMGLSEREYIGVGSAMLLLEEKDFPEAMTAIGGFDPEMESRLKGLALRQWYVFNHTEAWKWLEANWAFFDEDELEVIICEFLQDCYSVNPVFAFEKQKGADRAAAWISTRLRSE